MAEEAFPIPNEIDDEAVILSSSHSYREYWAIPLAASGSLLGFMNIVANVPDPNAALEALFPGAVQIVLSAAFGFLCVSVAGTLHRIALRRTSYRRARADAASKGASTKEMDDMLNGKLRNDFKTAAGWAGIFILLSSSLLLSGYITLIWGYFHGGRIQIPHIAH